MNLIAKVAELQKLQASVIPGTRQMQEYDFRLALQRSAPDMLAALGLVRAGDVDVIESAIDAIDFMIPSELSGAEDGDEALDFALDDSKKLVKMVQALRRYAELARLVEGKT